MVGDTRFPLWSSRSCSGRWNYAGHLVALVGVVAVAGEEKDLFELALVGEERLGGKEEPGQGAIAGQGTSGAVVRDSLSPSPSLAGGVPPGEVRVSRLSQGERPRQSLAPARHLEARTAHPHWVCLKTAVLPTGTCPMGSRQWSSLRAP